MNRGEALARLNATRASGKAIIGAGAGTGLSAKCAEMGGVDLIIGFECVLRGEAAEERTERVAVRADVGPEEQRGLDALAHHGHEGGDADRGRAGGERGAEVALEVAAHVASRALHPEDHRGDERDGHQRGDADEGLERSIAEVRRGELEHCADGEAEGDGEADAEPEGAEPVAAVGADEEGDEDADDERGLEALAESDEQAGEHGVGTPSWVT